MGQALRKTSKYEISRFERELKKLEWLVKYKGIDEREEMDRERGVCPSGGL